MRAMFSIVLVTAGCAGAPLTESERSVRILRKSDPPATCQEIGKVQAVGVRWSNETLDDELKRATAGAGGDTVAVTDGEELAIVGVAFKCNP